MAARGAGAGGGLARSLSYWMAACMIRKLMITLRSSVMTPGDEAAVVGGPSGVFVVGVSAAATAPVTPPVLSTSGLRWAAASVRRLRSTWWCACRMAMKGV